MSDFFEELGEQLFWQESEAPHKFSENYLEKKKQILGQARKNSRRRMLSMAAGIVGVCCLAPVTVLGAKAVRAYFVQHQDSGTYADTYTFTKAEDATEKVFYVKLQADFPKEYQQGPSGNSSKIFRTSDGKCVTLMLYYAKSQNEIVLDNVISREELRLNGKNAVYSQFHTISSEGDKADKNVLLFFEEYGYAVAILGSPSVAREELLELCAHISLAETDYANADEGIFYTQHETAAQQANDIRDGRTVQAGEPFLLNVCDNDMKFLPVEIAIAGVEEIDSLAEIKDGMLMNVGTGEEYIAADGTLLAYERRKIRQGDGRDTLSEVVETKTVEQQLLKLTFTIRNMQDEERAIWLKTTASLYCEGAGEGFAYDRGKNDLGELGRTIMMDNTDKIEFSVQEGMTTLQKCVVLSAGECKTIQAVYVVDKDRMGEMYFSFTDAKDSGNGVVFAVECS